MHSALNRRVRSTRTAILLAQAAVAVSFFIQACDTPVTDEEPRAVVAARRLLDDGISDLARSLEVLDSALQSDSASAAAERFRDARRAFKRNAALLNYIAPFESATLNGPLIAEDEVPNPLPKTTLVGFQPVEAAIFDSSITRDSARAAVAGMISVVQRTRTFVKAATLTEADIVDAARIELARIVTIGLAGFDTGPSGDACVEGAEAVEGIRLLMATADAPPEILAGIDSTLAAAAADLRANPDPEKLNRLRFIVGFLNPAASAIGKLSARTGAPREGLPRPWRTASANIFERDAFDVFAFSPPGAIVPNPQLVALGERLFSEPKLSGPGTRACVSCHVPDKAFADGRTRPAPLAGVGHAGARLRNTPTLLNAALQRTQFADDRAGSLETQVKLVLESPMEMSSSPDGAAAAIAADTSYQAAFAIALLDRRAGAVTGLEIQQALATFMRSLITMDSPFDKAVRGDTSAMTAEERRGFDVYMGKGRCGTCHFIPLFNGVMPPEFQTSEPEVIGVPEHADLARAKLDPDRGRGAIDRIAMNTFAFKVPTLRNIALTAPYMHNGVFTTLEQVVEFYDRGGGAGLGMKLPNQTLPSEQLKLTKEEKAALVAFMKALSAPAAINRTIDQSNK